MPPAPPTYPPAPPFPVGTLSGEVVVYTQAQIQQCLDSPDVTTIRLRYFVTLDGTPLDVCRLRTRSLPARTRMRTSLIALTLAMHHLVIPHR